jgi:5-methylthioadenosine/S-adenosylhomocysteine deaminase
MGAYECLLNGVGFVWDHYYFGRATANALQQVGLAGVVAPTLQDLAGPGIKWLERQWDETHHIASHDDFANAGIFAAYGPHATDTVSTDLWKRIAKEAKQTELPIHTHLAQSQEEYLKVFSREGKSPVQYLKNIGLLEKETAGLFVHGIFISKDELPLLATNNKALVFCPFSQLIFQFPAAVAEWEKAGVRWTVATDCVASNDSMNVQKELRYVAGLANMGVTYSPEHQRFLNTSGTESAKNVGDFRSSQQDLSMKFSDSEFLLQKLFLTSESLHPKFRVGRLSAGSLANLIVWDNTHPSMWPATQNLRTLAMGDTTQAIHNMMVAGKWVGKDGNFHNSLVHSSEYESSLREAEERLNALKNRL